MKKILFFSLAMVALTLSVFASEKDVQVKDTTEEAIDFKQAKEKARKAVLAENILEATMETEDSKTKYVITTERKAKFLGFFNFTIKSEVKINTDTGSISEVNEP
jgi:uncharacterized membrane protein YkoI